MNKTGYVGFVGLANSGKSTLLNTLLGEKVCIVSSKPQATRRRIQGILTTDGYQVMIMDSPGFLSEAMTPLHDFLLQEAQDVIASVAVVVFLVPMDLQNKEDLDELTSEIKKSKKPCVYVFTKMDLEPTPAAAGMMEYVKSNELPYFTAAEKESRILLLRKFFESVDPYMTETEEFLFAEDLFTTERSRDLMSEYIREGCMEHLAKEIPYNIAVVIDSYKEDEGLPKIYASIFVNRESHKSIVIGRGGMMLKKIGTYARKRFEEMIGEKVFLSLRVKTKEDWAKNKHFMNEIGYGKK
ncbi:MAG: GTPase Era [Bdellovibrionaceae bacterium]|nr:GTPase Era [Pseudobdellovibrionaceae bacterium]